MRFTIAHRTLYRYPAPVHESHTILHLQPRSDLTQYCTRFSVDVRPRAQIFAYADRFANDVQHFVVPQEHELLEIVTRSEVATVRGDATAPSPLPRRLIDDDPARDAFYDFLHPSEYVSIDSVLDGLAGRTGTPGPGDDAVAWFWDAAMAVHDALAYDTSATSVHSTIAHALEVGGGVCQDFAHVLIALRRRAGIPARYVSGYVFGGSDVLGAEASHAWCEAYLGPHGWIGLDATNQTWIGDTFVRVAVGRDYADVSPVRGIFRGAGEAALSVDVDMEARAHPQPQ